MHQQNESRACAVLTSTTPKHKPPILTTNVCFVNLMLYFAMGKCEKSRSHLLICKGHLEWTTNKWPFCMWEQRILVYIDFVCEFRDVAPTKWKSRMRSLEIKLSILTTNVCFVNVMLHFALSKCESSRSYLIKSKSHLEWTTNKWPFFMWPPRILVSIDFVLGFKDDEPTKWKSRMRSLDINHLYWLQTCVLSTLCCILPWVNVSSRDHICL